MFAQTDKASHLYRIAQEAVNNALKHAGGTGVRIALSSSAREIALSIEDNGCGFDPAAPAHSGIGLHIMNYRASLIGASLSVNSVSGTGTRVICRLPQAS
jgi:signal transduction histidine kinase